MDVAPENSLTHRNSTSFVRIVQTVNTLKSIHTSSELIHFVSQQLPVDTSSALQESQSVSTPIRESLFFLKHLKPISFLDSKMYALTTTMKNNPKKRTPGIKMLRVWYHVEGIHLDGRIGDEVELNVDFCLRLPQHYWGSASYNVSLLSSAVKSSAIGTIQAYAYNGPITPKRKKLIYADA